MEVNEFNSDNYIYLKLNNDFESKNYDLKKGRILRFLRSNLEDKVYSRLISQGISEGLQYNRKKEVLDADILPHQVNNSISFKENTRASLILWPHERYCLNDWMMEHLTNSEEFERDFSRGFYGKCKDINLDAIKRGCIEALPDKNRLPMIEVGKDNVELIFNFKKGEELDFQDPGVMSLLIDHEMGGLLSNSSVIEGKEKDELFISDFQNAFFDSDGISDDDDHCIYHYYKVNDDIKAKSFTDFPYIYVNVASYDTEGFINYIYMETFSRMDFSRYWEETIKEFAQEVPLEDAKIMHRERLRLEKIKEEEQMKEWEKEEKERKKG